MAKLKINCKPVVPLEQTQRNIGYAMGLGLPMVSEQSRPPLIVCGGGHSIRQQLDEVRAFKGDRWLIGSSFKFWREHGVDGTFFSVHPSPAALKNIEGVKRAIVSTNTDPAVLDGLIAQGADVQLFDLLQDGQVCHGSTTATVAPIISVKMGYRAVLFYGCDSDYGKTTHAYMSVEDPYLMRVSVNGADFLTGAEFLMQAEFLSAMIRAAPHVFGERSGGLLSALVECGDYDVTHISKTLQESAA
jgi:hypothetical protein